MIPLLAGITDFDYPFYRKKFHQPNMGEGFLLFKNPPGLV